MAAHILQCKAVSPCSSLDSSPLHCLALPLKMPIYPRLNAISSAITPHLLQKSQTSLSLLFPFSSFYPSYYLLLLPPSFSSPLMFQFLLLLYFPSLLLSLSPLFPCMLSSSPPFSVLEPPSTSPSLSTPLLPPLPSLSSVGLGITFSSAV